MNFHISWSDTSTWLLSDTRPAGHTIDYAVSFIQNQQPIQPQIYFGTSASYILLWKSQWMDMGRSFVLWIYLFYKLRGHSICILKLLWLFRVISLLEITIYSLLSIRTLLIYILSLPCTILTQDWRDMLALNGRCNIAIACAYTVQNSRLWCCQTLLSNYSCTVAMRLL